MQINYKLLIFLLPRQQSGVHRFGYNEHYFHVDATKGMSYQNVV